jgi:hypothetical protein
MRAIRATPSGTLHHTLNKNLRMDLHGPLCNTFASCEWEEGHLALPDASVAQDLLGLQKFLRFSGLRCIV